MPRALSDDIGYFSVWPLYRAAAFFEFSSVKRARIDNISSVKCASLEIDFVIVYRDRPCIVEVKSGENKKSKALNTLMAPDRYGVDQAIRLSRNNIGEKSGILSIPLYMIMFLRNEMDQPLELAGPDELRKHIDDDRL